MALSADCCCVNCFSHPLPKSQLNAQPPSTLGQCYFCGAQGALAPMSVLAGGFCNLLTDYVRLDEKEEHSDPLFPPVSLTEAIQRDWHVFSERFWLTTQRDEFVARMLS